MKNELTQLGLQELHAFQEATGCDTAAQYMAQLDAVQLSDDAIHILYCADDAASTWHHPERNYRAGFKAGFHIAVKRASLSAKTKSPVF